MNTDNLRKVQVDILSHPDDFDMSHWVKPKLEPRGTFLGFDLGMRSCGTVACIAGRTCGLFGNLSNLKEESIFSLAQGMLGFSEEQAYALFYQKNWPADLEARYELAASSNNKLEMARAASDAIDRFIEDFTQFNLNTDSQLCVEDCSLSIKG